MMWHRMAVTALAMAAVAAGGWLVADEPKSEPAQGQGRRDRLDAMAAKLGLNDQQKQEITKVFEDYRPKLADAEHKVWALHHEEHEAMSKVLDDKQRAELPKLLKAARDKELDEIATKLGLSADEKAKVEKVREEHEAKFHEAAAQAGDQGRTMYRELRRDFHEALGKELTAEQREKLPGVLREEFRDFRDPEKRREHLKAIGDELGLSAEQKDKMKQLHEEYDAKAKPLVEELHQVRHEEHEAVDKILTADQRTKLEELRKERESGEKPAKTGA